MNDVHIYEGGNESTDRRIDKAYILHGQCSELMVPRSRRSHC
jgi:hypothetical protein